IASAAFGRAPLYWRGTHLCRHSDPSYPDPAKCGDRGVITRAGLLIAALAVACTAPGAVSPSRSVDAAATPTIPLAPSSVPVARWDMTAGAVRWITADEPRVRHESPVWSADGTAIYYAAHSSTSTSYTDLGIFKIGLDGSANKRVHGPDGNGGMPVRLTPDGTGLVWVRARAGGGTAVVDLETGASREFDPTSGSYPEAWRSARPRALVISGGCCA